MTTPFYASTKSLDTDWHMALGPSAMYVASLDRTVVVWTSVGASGNKNVHAAAYNHATSAWEGPFVAGNFSLPNDNHGQAAICQDTDGYFHVFYGSHASAQHHSVSTLPDDISAWTQRPGISGAQTYPASIVVAGTIYLFLRNDTTLSRCLLSVRTATPTAGLATFSAFVNLVDFGSNSRAYRGEAYPIGSDIHFVATRSDGPNTVRQGVYYFVYDTTTGSLRNHDGSVSVAAGSLPIDLATANTSFRLFDHGTGQGEVPSLCFDTNGEPHILFADNGGSGSSYALKHIKRTAGVWSSPTVVDGLTDLLSGSGYTTIYGALAGGSASIEAWYINANGDKLRRVRDSGGTWATVETVLEASPGRPLVGQQTVRNAHPDLRALFSEISTQPLDMDAIPAKRYAHGDSGFLPAVISSADGDSLFSKVSLLLGFEHRNGSTILINDAPTGIMPSIIGGGAKIDTATAKHGAGSLLLDGSGDYIAYAHNPLFSVSQGDFCAEFYVRRNGSKLQCIASKRPSSGSSEWALYLNASNQLQALAFNTTVAVVNITGVTALSSGVDYLASLTRQASTWRLFLDGVLEADGVESAPPVGNLLSLHIGRDPGVPSRDFDGRIDEARFTSGAARYIAAFTPSTAPFPRDYKTTLSAVLRSFNARRISDSSFLFVDGSSVRQDLTAEAATASLADQDIEAQLVALRDAVSGAARDELDEALRLAQS